MKRQIFPFRILLILLIFTSVNTAFPKRIKILPVVPGETVVTGLNENIYKKLGTTLIKVSGNTSVVFNENDFLIQEGSLLQAPLVRKKDKILKDCSVKILFQDRSGSAVFVMLKIPLTSSMTNSNVLIHYYYNESDEYVQEAKFNYLYKNEEFQYFGFFVPFNLLWENNKAAVTSDIEIDKNYVMKLSASFSAEKTDFITQKIKFSKSKSKEIVKADRSKYKEEQRVRWLLWTDISESFDFDGYSAPLDDTRYITSQFGMTRAWILSNGRVLSKDTHMGIDYYSKLGASVYTVLSGKVVFAGKVEYYGNMVIIDHGMGLFSNYCHMNSISVSAGGELKAGEKIGEVGMTGVATGPHLHHEVRVYGLPVNPLLLKEFESIFKKTN